LFLDWKRIHVIFDKKFENYCKNLCKLSFWTFWIRILAHNHLKMLDWQKKECTIPTPTQNKRGVAILIGCNIDRTIEKQWRDQNENVLALGVVTGGKRNLLVAIYGSIFLFYLLEKHQICQIS